MTSNPLSPEELDAAIDAQNDDAPPAVLTAYWVSRDGNQGRKAAGTEDLTDDLDQGADLLRVTEAFWGRWEASVRAAEARMDPGLVVMPTAADVLSPSRY